MKIQYLGTAAAEGIPAIFCQCETCKKSRKAGGKNIRTRSQALIDDTILIDLPADTYMHSLMNNIDLSKIHTCIITHDHGDHLYPLEIANRRNVFAHLDDGDTLDIYVTTPGYNKLALVKEKFDDNSQHRVQLHKIEQFESFVAQGYEINAFKAYHSELCEPVFYAIKKDEKSILYAHDTGIFLEETWDALKKYGTKFDLVSLDCTFSVQPWTEGEHMTLKSNAIVRDRLFEMGLADENTVFVANHFTHNGMATHDEIKKVADEMGFITSYDGMVIEV